MTCNKPGSMNIFATVMKENARRSRGGAALALKHVSDTLSIQVLRGQNKG